MALTTTIQKRWNEIRSGWEYSVSGPLPLTASPETITTLTCTVKSWNVLCGANAGSFTLTPGVGTALTIPLGVGENASFYEPMRMVGGFTVSASAAGMTLDLIYER